MPEKTTKKTPKILLNCLSTSELLINTVLLRKLSIFLRDSSLIKKSNPKTKQITAIIDNNITTTPY